MSLLRRIEKGQSGGGNQPGAPGGGGNNNSSRGGGDDPSRLDAIRNRRVPVPAAAQGGAAKEGYVDLKARVQTKPV